jgi:site-specific DNA-methyltransferase (adenine-specific)
VWLLGPHRLAVGDSTDPNVWDALLAGGKADCMWTDPPYGVAYVGKTKDALTIENDALDEDGLADFLGSVLALALVNSRPGAAWFVASPPGPLHLVFGAALHRLDVLRQTLIWVKDQFVMGRSDYHYRHEPIFYGWTPGAAHHPPSDRKQDTIHEVARPKRSKDHPTMKPVELIERHLGNSTDPGHIVIDPFGGSGSTLIAAHRTSRVARLIELDPKYADVILRRYTEHTGNTPTREGTADTYQIPTGG